MSENSWRLIGEDSKMGFRTLEISSQAEIHIQSGQLQVTTEKGMIQIPVEDLSEILVHGAGIRLSTMDLSILSQNKVALVTLDDRYLPTSIVLPFEGHSRQSKVMHAQISASEDLYESIWMQIIHRKIKNQGKTLMILNRDGAEKVYKYAENITPESVDYCEALAAKVYFENYHDGLNRRIDDPINSRLNYGYAVVRSAIARKLVATGFHPTFGIHHDSQLNAFNLADDLIEPYRAMVDLVANDNIGTNIRLSKEERKSLAHVLHNACIVDGVKVNVLTAIDLMVESLRRIILDDSGESLKLPAVIPLESMEGITE